MSNITSQNPADGLGNTAYQLAEQFVVPLALSLAPAAFSFVRENGWKLITALDNAFSLPGAYAVEMNTEDEIHNQGVAHYRQGRYSEAIEDFTRVVVLKGESSLHAQFDWLSSSHFKAGNYDESINYAEKALKKAREDLGTTESYISYNYFIMGTSKYNIGGRYNEVVTDLTKAEELGLSNPSLFYYRGVSHFKIGDNFRAISDLRAALVDITHNNNIQHWLGVAHYNIGEYEKAEEYFAGNIWCKGDKSDYNDYKWLIDTQKKTNGERVIETCESLVANDIYKTFTKEQQGYISKTLEEYKDRTTPGYEIRAKYAEFRENDRSHRFGEAARCIREYTELKGDEASFADFKEAAKAHSFIRDYTLEVKFATEALKKAETDHTVGIYQKKEMYLVRAEAHKKLGHHNEYNEDLARADKLEDSKRNHGTSYLSEVILGASFGIIIVISCGLYISNRKNQMLNDENDQLNQQNRRLLLENQQLTQQNLRLQEEQNNDASNVAPLLASGQFNLEAALARIRSYGAFKESNEQNMNKFIKGTCVGLVEFYFEDRETLFKDKDSAIEIMTLLTTSKALDEVLGVSDEDQWSVDFKSVMMAMLGGKLKEEVDHDRVDSLIDSCEAIYKTCRDQGRIVSTTLNTGYFQHTQYGRKASSLSSREEIVTQYQKDVLEHLKQSYEKLFGNEEEKAASPSTIVSDIVARNTDQNGDRQL